MGGLVSPQWPPTRVADPAPPSPRVVARLQPEFEDHSTHSVEPHRKSTRYTRVVRRVYLGIAGGCRRTFVERTRGGGFTPSF